MKAGAIFDVESGYRKSYMDKNLFMLGLEQLVNMGLKYIMEQMKKGIDSQDFWVLRTVCCSLKEIADYHGAKELSNQSAELKKHADLKEMEHIYPVYSDVARNIFYVRRSLIKYLKENLGTIE